MWGKCWSGRPSEFQSLVEDFEEDDDEEDDEVPDDDDEDLSVVDFDEESDDVDLELSLLDDDSEEELESEPFEELPDRLSFL